jgi:uncharacterized membrane protein
MQNQNVSKVLLISIIHAVFILSVVFDLSVLRVITGLFFLLFVPGILMLELFKIDLTPIEKILFSVGLSVAFIMFAGFSINFLFSLADYSSPLSIIPVFIVFNILILLGELLVFFKCPSVSFSLKLNKQSLIYLVLILPIISVIGAVYASVGNTVLLLILIIAIAAVFSMVILSKKPLSDKSIAVIIFSISLALLYQSSMLSPYVWGGDVHLEGFIFERTLQNGFWDMNFLNMGEVFGRLNSMLSITTLPSVSSILLNLNSTLLLKIFYPLLFSFTMVALYYFWQRVIGSKKAFAAVFLIMATSSFYLLTSLNRQMVAELFLALLL